MRQQVLVQLNHADVDRHGYYVVADAAKTKAQASPKADTRDDLNGHSGIDNDHECPSAICHVGSGT